MKRFLVILWAVFVITYPEAWEIQTFTVAYNWDVNADDSVKMTVSVNGHTLHQWREDVDRFGFQTDDYFRLRPLLNEFKIRQEEGGPWN